MIRRTLFFAMVAIIATAGTAHARGLNSVGEVNAAKARKDLSALETTCMRNFGRINIMDAACDAATELISAAGNTAKLKAICNGQGSSSPYRNWRNRQKACKAMNQAGASGGMQAIRAAPCSTLESVWKKNLTKVASSRRAGYDAAAANFLTAAMKFVKCRKWNFVWEWLVHWGGSRGYGVALLNKLHDKGVDVEKQFLAYAKRNRRNPFSFRNAYRTLDNFTTYLHKKRKHRGCRKYLKLAERVPDKVWGPLNWFFRKARCKGAARGALKRLRSSNWQTRNGACKTLGELGSRRHLRKVRILARTDPYFKIRRRGRFVYKVYKVRDTCRAAAGRIQLN